MKGLATRDRGLDAYETNGNDSTSGRSARRMCNEEGIHVNRAVRWASGFWALNLALVWSCSGWTEELQKPRRGRTIKVFVLAGQSNMEGRADGAKLTSQDKERLGKVQDRIQLAYNHEPVRPLDVVKASPGIRRGYKRDLIFGPELFFGMALSEAWPDERVLFIKLTQGGTSLYGCWSPDWQAEKAAVMGEENEPRLYDDLTAYVEDVLSEYEEDEYEICAMLWVQGERDSGEEPASAAYGENLKRLVASVRRDLNCEALPFLLFQVGNERVAEGMRRTAREVPNVTLIPQSLDPDSPDFYEKMENGHYNYAGMKKLGGRMAEDFLRLYSHGGKSLGRAGMATRRTQGHVRSHRCFPHTKRFRHSERGRR